jgi:hypothetical protein
MSDTASSTGFCFVQLEFTHALTVPPGQYLTATQAVMAVDVVDGEVATSGRFAQIRRAEEPGARATGLAIVTHIRADLPGGAAVFAAARANEDRRGELIADALTALNAAIAMVRSARADPYLMEITAPDARVVRIGLGTPDDLHRGSWAEAFDVAPRRPRAPSRAAAVQLSQYTAEAVAGRLRPMEAELLALRALSDLEHGRVLAAEAQARAAVDVFRKEIGAGPADEHPGELSADTIERIARHVLESARERHETSLLELRERVAHGA